MKMCKPLFLTALLVCTLGLTTLAQAQTGPVIDLTTSTGTCQFQTDANGISASGQTPGVVSATITSFSGSGCPSGGATGPAQVILTSTPANGGSVALNDTVTVQWHATADVCQYDGTSFPAGVTGWPSDSSHACVGAANCAQAHTFTTPALAVAGNYKFGLTCWSGAHPTAPQAKTTTVKVGGGTQTVSCVAPAGLTRQTVGKLADFGGVYSRTQMPLTSWDEVFGINWAPVTYYYAWPGLSNSGSKMYVTNHDYLSLEFTVPSTYPVYTSASGKPYGTFQPSGSNETNGITWAVSISKDCGDFMQPSSTSAPTYNCYKTYTPVSGKLLTWLVTAPAAPLAGACNLNPGETYFFNIVAGTMNNPAQSTCSDSICRIDFQQTGNFDSGAFLNH